MSCEYCRGEKDLYTFDRHNLHIGDDLHEYEFNTRIAKGRYLGTSSGLDYKHIGGACCVINYCPMCGDRLDGRETDRVDVIRCHDCKWWNRSAFIKKDIFKYGFCICDNWDFNDSDVASIPMTTGDSYCAFGERKEVDDDRRG